MRQSPFGIAGDWHWVWLLVRAPHRGLRCIGNLFCMGLFADFLISPTPTGDVPDDSLTTLVDTHMLDRDLLLCASSVRLQRLEL